MKIVVIAIYYGQLPEWFNLWLKSCEYNKNIDFIFITDQEVKDTPINVQVLKITFEKLKKLISKKLEYDIILEKPYKLCDFRPMYGLIFEEIVKEYDYWGHCDIDLIFGDIEYFIEKYNIERYEKFLHLGHLSLYKNTYENNRNFKRDVIGMKNWKEVVTDGKNFYFDEWSGIYKVYKQYNIPMFENRIFADISMIYKRFRLALKDINYDYQVFYWENGKVYRNYIKNSDILSDEFIYIHFKKRKLKNNIFNSNNIEGFYITNNGFFEKKKKITKEEIKNYNLFQGKIREKIELFLFNLKELLKK